MQRLHVVGGGFGGIYLQVAVLVPEQLPQLLQEAMASVNAVGIPGLALLHGAEEHFIQAQGVGTVALNYHVGVHHVEHALGHLLHGPAADVLVVLQDELGCLVLGTPCLEGLHVQNVVLHYVHVHVDWCCVVLVLEAQAYEGVGVLDTVNEVASSLNHTLVDEFLEGFLLLAHAQVEEELVPEARVDEVTCGMLAAAHVEVNVLPVFRCLLANESLAVVGVHVAQVVCT